MGRANITIAGLGLAACLFLSMLMKNALQIQTETDVPPVVREIQEEFGSRLSGPPGWRVEELPAGKVGELELASYSGVGQERLAETLGRYTWRRVGSAIDALVVTVASEGRPTRRFQVGAPTRREPRFRRLGDEQAPTFWVPPATDKGKAGTKAEGGSAKPLPNQPGAPGKF